MQPEKADKEELRQSEITRSFNRFLQKQLNSKTTRNADDYVQHEMTAYEVKLRQLVSKSNSHVKNLRRGIEKEWKGLTTALSKDSSIPFLSTKHSADLYTYLNSHEPSDICIA